MKQIITLEKEIAFKTMVGEISSISLEPDLSFINDSEIEGSLVISGTYKMTEASTIEEEFNYKVPVEIMLTTSLEKETRRVDINNFTYAIVNEEALQINVELLIEGLEKVEIEDTLEEEKEDDLDIREGNEGREDIEVLTTKENEKEELTNFEKSEEVLPSLEDIKVIEGGKKEVETTLKEENNNNKQVMDSIFSAFANTEETYSTYSVYILREDDNLEEVISRYNTNKEVLAEYNDLDNLKVGSKLIIPTTIEVND